MRTASGLALIAVGAILAFAVTTSTPLVNVHIVGWVLILTGIVGLVIPKRGYGWLRRRIVLRPGQRGPVVSRVDETRYPQMIRREAAAQYPTSPGDTETIEEFTQE